MPSVDGLHLRVNRVVSWRRVVVEDAVSFGAVSFVLAITGVLRDLGFVRGVPYLTSMQRFRVPRSCLSSCRI